MRSVSFFKLNILLKTVKKDLMFAFGPSFNTIMYKYIYKYNLLNILVYY